MAQYIIGGQLNMPRHARHMSTSGFMHIITRGIGRQLLFEEPEDYRHYLTALERYCIETCVNVCAYCLMENHVHLLVHGEAEQIITFMKKLGVSYSFYFNRKYDRVGHLFQDRYRSEPVENDAYLLTVFRYILRNPCKAGICKASEYPWSSYSMYVAPPQHMNLDLIHEKLGSYEQYRDFIETDNEDDCMEYEEIIKDDAWAQSVLRKHLGIQSGTILQQYDKNKRNEALKKLKNQGLTIRQIERLTGINRNIVQRVTSES